MKSEKNPYEVCVDASERVSWRIADVLPDGAGFDFSRHFLPESLVDVSALGFLDDAGRLALNHIAGNAYLNLFHFVEEYIVADVLRHAQAAQFDDEVELRALLRFAEEEVKHQLLFKRCQGLFAATFGTPCGVLESAEVVAGFILGKSPMAVQLTTLHLEQITQQHYVEHIKQHRVAPLDELFVSLLHHHWMEEAQHARLDSLELEKLFVFASAKKREEALGEYLEILGAFDGLLQQQAGFDVESLAATGVALTADQQAAVGRSQHLSYRETFIFMGLRHPNLLLAAENMTANGRARIAEFVAQLRGRQ